MDGNKKASFGKRSHSKFDSRGSKRKSKKRSFNRERNVAMPTPNAIDTVYRILCPGKKIGGVIGKGGSIINALRDETLAKIRVADTVRGAEERVIIIFSSPTRNPRNYNISQDPENNELTEKEYELLKPHCPAQDALMKVQGRIFEEDDQYEGKINGDNEGDGTVVARLLVPSNQVGCLIGKGGNIIQKLRSETGANIRILPAEHLPACAMDNDELVQISGIPTVAKKALYAVSTLLHQNPRKEIPPLNNPVSFGVNGLYPSGAPMEPMMPPGNPMWSHQKSSVHGTQPMPWFGGYANESSGYAMGDFNSVSGGNGGEKAEFCMKILCSVEKIGGVIGKGGSNVKQLQQETGANIHVDDMTPEADERVILVSATEAPWDPISPTVQAVLQLQGKTSEVTEKGIFVTRLLVPSSKVGCLLGQGGHVITEMRRRTQADIRVYSKSDKPTCASADEELVQISGTVNVAKEALSEIASRLRMRTFKGANAPVNPAPVGTFQGVPPENFSARGPPPSGMIGAGSSGDYGLYKGGGPQYQSHGYPVQSAANGYPNVNSMEVKIPNSAVGVVLGSGGSNISNIRQISGAKVKLHDPLSSASECVVEIHGSSEQMNAAQSLLQAFVSSGGNNQHVQQGHRPY
eukprot:TRINITY_DN10864_c0_g1_i1.p1 TRINITY_DN10864_c0_g1~~TRINITY_DN10864_c0_g1_i1.p1  ORF type:complete len:655 (+),score=142.11 TRINITY_DN10864_c0_g1_i1:65-1966(+)